MSNNPRIFSPLPMKIIQSYGFGVMTINGQTFTKDLIILPDGAIHGNWFRQSGHVLILEDIFPLIDAAPERIIAGTGASGLMKISQGLEKSLQDLGIELTALPTKKAADLFNRSWQADGRTAGCFHLTC